jgi:hypothetical protein
MMCVFISPLSFCRPWHVFANSSPNTDADFEIAATFDEEQLHDDVNFVIVECLEGSERKDELLVAQYRRQAEEAGQLDRVSEMSLPLVMKHDRISFRIQLCVSWLNCSTTSSTFAKTM